MQIFKFQRRSCKLSFLSPATPPPLPRCQAKYCSLLSFWFYSNFCSVISGEWAVTLNFLEEEKEKNAWFFKRIKSFLFSCSFSSHSCLSSSNSRPCFLTTKLELPSHHIQVLSSCNVYASLLREASVIMMSRWHLRIARGKHSSPFLERNVAYLISLIQEIYQLNWWKKYLIMILNHLSWMWIYSM